MCVSCQSPAPGLAVNPLANSLERQSTSGGTEIVCRGFRPWCCDTGSSSHFTKLVMSSDPHGPLVTDPCLTRWCCSHPHAHHTLACSSTGKDELTDKFSLLALVRHPHTHSLARFLPKWTSKYFYIRPVSLGTESPPHSPRPTCALLP